jgi:hypothetical protein
MHILVLATFAPIRSGIAARSPALHLSGHGHDSDSAAASLAATVRAWCVGMAALGELEPALQGNGVRWEPGDGPVTVEVSRA